MYLIRLRVRLWNTATVICVILGLAAAIRVRQTIHGTIIRNVAQQSTEFTKSVVSPGTRFGSTCCKEEASSK